MIGKLKRFLLKSLWQDPNYDIDQMACNEIIIAGIDEELYAKLLGEATAAGAQFSGSVAMFRGCTFDWNYDVSNEELHVTCMKKPFYITCGVVEETIRDLALKAKGALA